VITYTRLSRVLRLRWFDSLCPFSFWGVSVSRGIDCRCTVIETNVVPKHYLIVDVVLEENGFKNHVTDANLVVNVGFLRLEFPSVGKEQAADNIDDACGWCAVVNRNRCVLCHSF